MKTPLSLVLAAAAAIAALPCRAVEPEPATAMPSIRLTFADGWTLRSSEPADGRQAEADAAGPNGAPRTANSDAR